VLAFPRLFGRDMMFPEALPGINTPNAALLYSSTTGDPGDAGYMPLAAVRWLTPPREIAALVTETGPRNFAAELFHFGPSSRPMGAELYLLQPGQYRYQLTASDKSPGPEGPFSVSSQRTRISFTLPARKLCVLEIRQR
jgi:hypothetical protein